MTQKRELWICVMEEQALFHKNVQARLKHSCFISLIIFWGRSAGLRAGALGFLQKSHLESSISCEAHWRIWTLIREFSSIIFDYREARNSGES